HLEGRRASRVDAGVEHHEDHGCDDQCRGGVGDGGPQVGSEPGPVRPGGRAARGSGGRKGGGGGSGGSGHGRSLASWAVVHPCAGVRRPAPVRSTGAAGGARPGPAGRRLTRPGQNSEILRAFFPCFSRRFPNTFTTASARLSRVEFPEHPDRPRVCWGNSGHGAEETRSGVFLGTAAAPDTVLRPPGTGPGASALPTERSARPPAGRRGTRHPFFSAITRHGPKNSSSGRPPRNSFATRTPPG